MLAYVTIGTNNKEKAVAFYAELLGELGAKQLFNNERLVFFGTDMTTPMIAVGTPFDGEAATNGNGTMLAIPVGSRENVDKIYAKALALGATDEGAPGERPPGFYGGLIPAFYPKKPTNFPMGGGGAGRFERAAGPVQDA